MWAASTCAMGEWTTRGTRFTKVFPLSYIPLLDPRLKMEELVEFPGCDYANSRIKDWKNVENFEQCDIEREREPRMPWHDISVKVGGGAINMFNPSCKGQWCET